MIGNRGFQYTHNWVLFVLAVVGLCIVTAPCNALEPHEILVVANKNAARSVGLAKYYMKKRNIPHTNLVELWITAKERCSRQDYEERAIYKIRKHLKEKDPNKLIRCLVTMYGVPLKVQPPEMTKEERKQVEDLRKRRKIFFGLLVDGRLSLAECYALAKPFWSWQMVLIGDPLYRPFGRVK